MLLCELKADSFYACICAKIYLFIQWEILNDVQIPENSNLRFEYCIILRARIPENSNLRFEYSNTRVFEIEIRILGY